MIIEIVKSSNPKFWYANLIGKRFEAVKEKDSAKEYVIKRDESFLWDLPTFYVNEDDCAISQPDFLHVYKTCKCCGTSSWMTDVPEWQIEKLNLEAQLDMRQIIQEAHQRINNNFN